MKASATSRQTEQVFRGWTREPLLESLHRNGTAFEEAIHSAVFTMAQSAALGLKVPGGRCKNLLVRGIKKACSAFSSSPGPMRPSTIPRDKLYGVNSVRGRDNLSVSTQTVGHYPAFIQAFAQVK